MAVLIIKGHDGQEQGKQISWIKRIQKVIGWLRNDNDNSSVHLYFMSSVFSFSKVKDAIKWFLNEVLFYLFNTFDRIFLLIFEYLCWHMF